MERDRTVIRKARDKPKWAAAITKISVSMYF
jgi:hypothetical protein